MRCSDVIQTLDIIEVQTIILRFDANPILLKKLNQTSAMVLALSLSVANRKIIVCSSVATCARFDMYTCCNAWKAIFVM